MCRMSLNAALLFHKHMGLQANAEKYNYPQAKLPKYLELKGGGGPENGQYPSLSFN